MRTLSVPLGEKSYDICIDNGLMSSVGQRIRALLPKARRLVVVTDENVYPLYANKLLDALRAQGFEAKAHVLPAGEVNKNIDSLMSLYRAFSDFSITRTDAVLALGGGVVGDLTGFAAATFLRGIAYIQLPTTLLAQIDASVGGKTAIDLPSGKNQAGAFWQPRAVYIDTNCLGTLPDSEFTSGMAEVIKYGCIMDEAFFTLLEANNSRDKIIAIINDVIYTCVKHKATLVSRDEMDMGERMLLNFGHTLGHAYELEGNYTTYTHGQAVAAGMCAAAKLGQRLGITQSGTFERIFRLLTAFNLPTEIPCSTIVLRKAIGADKKNVENTLRFIMLEKIGKAKAYPLRLEDII